MLYIIRHGKTDWNAKHKLQGKTDIPLNEDGRKMAREAATAYRKIHFDVCYCSPLCRARETAEILLKGREIPIFFDERLSEMGFGIYEGTENCFNTPSCPMNVLFFTPELYKSPVEGGESLQALYERTGAFLSEIVEPQLQQGKDILIVGHGAMNSSIICQVKRLPVKNFWSAGIDNCKLMRLI